MAYRGVGPHSRRRFPHLTEADLDVLAQLAPPAARSFEELIRRQHRADQAYAARATPLEALDAARATRPTGGGRKRERHSAADSVAA